MDFDDVQTVSSILPESYNTPTQLQVLYYFSRLMESNLFFPNTIGYGPIPWNLVNLSSIILWKKMDFSLPEGINWLGFLCTSSIRARFCLAWARAGLLDAVISAVGSAVWLSNGVQTTLLPCIHLTPLVLIIFCPLLHNDWWALNPSRKWLVAPIMFTPALHQWAHLARPVDTIAFRVHSWVSLIVTFLFQWHALYYEC